MSFFESFFEIAGDKTETPVCCPFPHAIAGTTYKEQHPSAHVNVGSGLIHCKACGRGHSQISFIQEILGCNYIVALQLARLYDVCSDRLAWEENTALTGADMSRLNALGISAAVAQELKLCSHEGALAFPLFMYDKLLDIRAYRPNEKPKMRSLANAISGLVMPFDLWRRTDQNRTTLICAGG